MQNHFIHQEITPNKGLPFRLLIHSNAEKHTVIRHWHRSLEISYTVSGRVEDYYLDGKHYSPQKNDILIINPYSIHGINFEQQTGRLSLTLMFPTAFLTENKIDLDKYKFINPLAIEMKESQKKAYSQLQDNFKELSLLAQIPITPTIRLKIMSLVFNILHDLSASFLEEKKLEPIFIGQKHFKYLEHITHFIDNHYMNRLGIAELSQEFHLSEGYLSRLFKKYMGISISQYIIQVRLQKAHQLLLNSNYTIEEISQLAGFPNKKSFTKVFKADYTLTPHQYRLQYYSSSK